MAVHDRRNRAQQRDQRERDAHNPEQNLYRTGERKQAQHRDDRGQNHGDGQQFVDDRAVAGERLARKEVCARGVIVRDHHDGTVARRRQRTGGLVVSDDVLRKTAVADLGKLELSYAFERIYDGDSDGQDEPDAPQHARDAHQDHRDKQDDAHCGVNHLVRRRGGELLHLRCKTMVAEDLRDDLGGGALLLAARRRDAGVLKEMVQICSGISHVGLHIAIEIRVGIALPR